MPSALLWLACIACASAQPRNVETFGFAGAAHLEDEGSLGNGPAFGGALTLPFARRWAVDLDVVHVRTKREESSLRFGGNRAHLAPALQYRAGGRRSYGFAALAASAAASATWSQLPAARFASRDSKLTLHGRAGFVAAVTERWLFRAGVFAAFRSSAPDFGVRAGARHRF